MNLSTAIHYAGHLLTWIQPYVDRAEVAGSIRRQRPACNDVDIVCIPKIKEEQDLFGEVVSHKNLLHEFLRQHVAKTNTFFLAGGDTPGKQVILQLPRCQLDLWFATPEAFATRLMCRTGSRDHNIWLASRAKARGWKWNPYEGLIAGGEWSGDQYVGGQIIARYETEDAIFRALNLPFIAPEHRELPWLIENFGA